MSKRACEIEPTMKEKKPKLELDDDDGQVQIGPVANIVNMLLSLTLTISINQINHVF